MTAPGLGRRDGLVRSPATTVRTPPRVRFVREIGPDTLMGAAVAAVAADPAWEPGRGRRVFDTRLEILHLQAGTVVA